MNMDRQDITELSYKEFKARMDTDISFKEQVYSIIDEETEKYRNYSLFSYLSTLNDVLSQGEDSTHTTWFRSTYRKLTIKSFISYVTSYLSTYKRNTSILGMYINIKKYKCKKFIANFMLTKFIKRYLTDTDRILVFKLTYLIMYKSLKMFIENTTHGSFTIDRGLRLIKYTTAEE